MARPNYRQRIEDCEIEDWEKCWQILKCRAAIHSKFGDVSPGTGRADDDARIGLRWSDGEKANRCRVWTNASHTSRDGSKTIRAAVTALREDLRLGIDRLDTRMEEGVRNFVCGHSMRSVYAPQTEKCDA